VIVLDNPSAAVYRLRPPFRVIRGGRVVLDRPDEGERTLPVIRLDLTIDGEPVIVFARTADSAPGKPAGMAK
jgi:hypothetical protein